MKQSFKQCGEQMLCAIRRPEVRHSLHCQCGLYKNSAEHAPIASINIHNDCAVSLVHLLAVVGALALVLMAAHSAVCAKKRGKCSRNRKCNQ